MKTRAEITDIILIAIADVAPDADIDGLDLDQDFRDDLDLDSMDLLNIVIRVVKATDVQIPDAVANKLLSVNSMADYLLERS